MERKNVLRCIFLLQLVNFFKKTVSMLEDKNALRESHMILIYKMTFLFINAAINWCDLHDLVVYTAHAT